MFFSDKDRIRESAAAAFHCFTALRIRIRYEIPRRIEIDPREIDCFRRDRLGRDPFAVPASLPGRTGMRWFEDQTAVGPAPFADPIDLFDVDLTGPFVDRIGPFVVDLVGLATDRPFRPA